MIAILLASAASLSTFRAVYIDRVYDGDTFKVTLANEEEVFGKNLSIRIRGIDSPEIKSKRSCEVDAAGKSKQSLERFLAGKRVDLNRCQRDKYFRVVCDVSIFGKREEDAAAYQLARGYAVPYDGRTKSPWVCHKGAK